MSQLVNIAAAPSSLKLDYSLVGVNSRLAIEKGLAEADWYQSPVPRDVMRELLERRDGPALRNTILWFALIFGNAYLTYRLWPRPWAAIPYLIYAALYASTSDSRWHESSHGTAFKTDWMNNALYEVSSFMVMRESVVWRWSHTRHHSDTIIVGRDPEISVPRPASLKAIAKKFVSFGAFPKYVRSLAAHVAGRMTPDQMTYIPATEFSKIYLRARIYVGIYAAVVLTSVLTRSLLPLLFIGLANFFGSWLMVVYSMTQHAGLAENVLDHRLNCRTVYMNPINRFLYWNMNYHVEHHMYPLVPFHNLPRLHEAVKGDCPAPYTSLLAAWKEIIPAVLKQVKDPTYHVKRELPLTSTATTTVLNTEQALVDADGWVDAGDAASLRPADVLRFDHGRKTFAIYRTADGKVYATDGICTHGNVHLSTGLVIGDMVECSKHNGRFHLADGSPARTPVCRGLVTYPVQETAGRLRLHITAAGGAGCRPASEFQFRVLSNNNVSTFIKELIVEPVDDSAALQFAAGDYLQFHIPAYGELRFQDFAISEPYAEVWRGHHIFDLVARNQRSDIRNNYSLASNRQTERTLRFNIRIATPPPGQACSPGVGSSYMFSLKAGDILTASGPFGDFHIRPTQKEMVYIGGGAGMAPLRAHLSHLLESEKTARKISFWYGARSSQELFYDDYFRSLAEQHTNFQFHAALSSPLETDAWSGHTGFIHEIVEAQHLNGHANPAAAEYYLCGPPMMIKACTRMLATVGVPASQISYDEF